jgi:hypothetical protein
MNLSHLHLEVGVSYHLHQRSFYAEEGGLLPLDEFIGSLLDGSSKWESKTSRFLSLLTLFRERETSQEKC